MEIQPSPSGAVLNYGRRQRLLLALLIYAFGLTAIETSSFAEASSSPVLTPHRENTMESRDSPSDKSIHIVFSDVDGTLVHYPVERNFDMEEGNRILQLPFSATGMKGIISSRTLVYCRDLRREQKLVLISGMRTATLLKRLPYLPRADAYCSEAGGRIFYPIEPKSEDGLTFQPVAFDGANQEDLAPFGIMEDMDWRRRIERAAGTEGYESDGLGSDELVSVAERKGLLWDFARILAAKGYIIDTKGYSTCFRVNRMHQTTLPEKDFEALLSCKVSHPEGLATSTNLGCVDYYPAESGKKNCCAYLAQRFTKSNKALSEHAVCLCDDDNDLEMALACQHAFVPGVSSESMADVIRAHPDQLTVTRGLEGTRATEKALEFALERIRQTVTK